jgi:probable HAF family extracellular repeat protein
MTTYTFSTLEEPLASGGTDAYGINDAGQIVGDFYDSLGTANGFFANGSATIAYTFSVLDAPSGSGGTNAFGINNAGQVVGQYIDNGGLLNGFLYSGGTYSTLDDSLGTNGTVANGINNAGQIVGEYLDSSGLAHGFLYSGGSFTTLDDPSGSSGTVAFGINNTGQIVGEYVDSNGLAHGFLYSGGTFTTLDDPLGANGTIAFGINNAGQIVGEYLDSSGLAHGFLYSGGTFTTLDDPWGSDGTIASGINNAGQIVGEYFDSSGTAHGFVASATSSVSSATSVQQEIVGLYAALYNRAADFPGYSFWVGIDSQQPDASGVTVANAANSAVTLTDSAVLGQAFVNTQSAYFNEIYGGLNDSQFINAMYVNIGGNNGDPSGIAYWTNLLQQAEASGESVLAARAGLAGQFVHDLIDIDLSLGAAALGLTAAQYQDALTRQATIDNKIAVSIAYSNASQQPGGSIFDPNSVGDAAYNAAITVLQGVTSDPTTVTVAVTGINNAVAHQDLTYI